MKLKILKGTMLFDRIDVVKKKMVDANKAAKKLATSIKGVTAWHISGDGIAGGLSGFKFKTGKPPEATMWKLAYPKKSLDAFFPKNVKSNKDLLKSISGLPIVKARELTEILEYDPQIIESGSGDRQFFSNMPGVIFKKNYILVFVSENSVYKKLRGMIEITDSEFKKLQK